jgi:hypothetical protein
VARVEGPGGASVTRAGTAGSRFGYVQGPDGSQAAWIRGPYGGRAYIDLPYGYQTVRIGGRAYYYYDGYYHYEAYYDGYYCYVACAPPVGLIVEYIPDPYESLVIDGITYYIYEGVYFVKIDRGFQVVDVAS